MKKLLLTLGALSLSIFAFADNESGDPTPPNYHFNTAKKIPWFDNGRGGHENGYGIQISGNGGNYPATGNGVWSNFTEPDEYWSDGLIGVTSAGGLASADFFLKGTGLLDLGGDVGQVMYFIGRDSGFLSSLNELFPNEKDKWKNLGVSTGNVGNVAYNFFLDPEDIWTRMSGYYRFRIIYNVYRSEFNETNVFDGLYQVNNVGNNTSFIGSSYDASNDAISENMVKSTKNNDFTNSDNNWDPTKWAVVDYYFNIAGDKDGKSNTGIETIPARIKLLSATGGEWNNIALLIKDIEITKFEGILKQDLYKSNTNEALFKTYYPGVNGITTIKDNKLSINFEKSVTKTDNELSISVNSKTQNNLPVPKIDFTAEGFTVELENYPAGEYEINIPKGYVLVNGQAINEAISETITIGKEYETGTVALLQGDQIGFTVTYSKDITNLQPTGQITLTPKTTVTTQPSLKKTQNGNVLTVTLEGGEAAVYTVTIPKDYFTLDVNLFSDEVSRELTVEKKYETGTVAPLEGGQIGFTVTYPTDIIDLLTGEIKVEPKTTATNLPTAEPTYVGKVLTVVLEGGDPGEYTVTVPKEYVKLGVNLFNKETDPQTLTVPESGGNTSGSTQPETPSKGKDITPANYHFNSATKIPWYNGTITNVNIIGSCQDIFNDPSLNLKNSYDEGLFILASAGITTDVGQQAYRDSWQLIDLGGDVGQVAMFAGKNSGIVDILNDYAPNHEDKWKEIKIGTAATAQWQLYLTMDPNNCPTGNKYVHCRMEYNIYSASAKANSKEPKSYFAQAGMLTNAGGIDDSYKNSTSGNVSFLENECNKNAPDSYEWDPLKWQVYEFDFKIPSADTSGSVYIPMNLRLSGQVGAEQWNNYAFFIKDISFTAYDGTPSDTPNFQRSSFNYENIFTYNEDEEPGSDPNPDPEIGKAITVTPTVEGNVLTATFENELKPNSGKEVSVSPKVEKENLEVTVEGKTITVTLIDCEAGEYTVTIPENFVTVGDKDYNAKIEGKITIEEEETENPGDKEDQDDPNYPKVNPGTPITPANYKFNEGGILPIHPQGYIGEGNANVPAGAWNSIKDYWDEGLMVVSSAGLNQNQHDGFVNSWNYIDFGGKVGRVACYINRGSTAIEDLKKLNSDEVWDDLNKNTQVFGGGALNFYLDPKNTPKTGYIHAKLVFNVDDLNESAKDGNGNIVGDVILQNINVRDDLNNNKCSYNGTSFVLDPITGEKVNVLKNEFTTNGNWDPTKWMTYEFDFKVDGTDKSADLSELPVRIKILFQANQSNNTSAIFFKEISFTHVDKAEPTMLGKVYQKMETLEIGTPKISFIPAEKMAASSVNVNENVLTATFDQNITLDETKSVTISPSSTTGKLDVKVNEKSIVITLTDYPYDTYTVTIPEGFVKVGDKGINEEIVQEIEISAPKVKDKEYYFPAALDIPAGYIDMTPSYYKFYNGKTDLDKMLRNDINSPTATNLGGDYFITNNMGDGKYFNNDNLSKGNLIYKAGMYQNDKENDRLRSAFSLFDFGGNVGEVLVLNGKNSKLNEAIAENFNLQTSYNISKPAGDFMNMQLMWLLDNPKMNSNLINGNYVVHVRMELNMYNNNMTTEYPLMSNMYLQRQTATTAAEFDLNDKFIDEFTYRVNEESYKEGEFNVNKTDKWNPYRWMVLDFETDYNRVVSYLRTFLQSNQMKDHSNGAWLIRSIEIYGIPSNVTSTYEKNKLYTSWNEYKASDFIVKEPTPEQAKEDPSEKSIVENTIPGDKVENEASFNGFQDDKDHENSWTIEDAKVAKYYYYNVSTGKNVTLADDATKDVVKVDANTITISAPADMGTEYHHGIVRINTGIEIQEGATYNFSAQATKAASTRAAANVPDILVKLTAESSNATSGLANKTENGVHYLSNAELTAGNLVLEIHFGGAANAGNDITLSNITLAQLTEGSSGGNNSGGNPGVGDEGGFIPGDYSGEPTVNRAMQFTQSGTVTCGAIPELNNLSSYSIQFWMKPQEWEEGATLLRRGDNFSVELGENHNIVFKNSDNEVIAKGLLANEWNQVTLMVNKGQATVLVNSVNGGSGTLGTLEETKRPFIMGGGYVGLLDEVRLWNDALSNNDLMTRFDYFTNNTLNKWNPMWNNLVAYYKMDQEAAPQVIEYKVLENRKADGTNNHGVISEVGVQRVLANNEKMPYLINVAYTENERFYDRLIPKDAYLLSNEIIVLGADCQASDGSVKTRLGNNHASIYGGVSYASIGGRTGVASFDGKSGSYIQAPAGIVHSYTADGNSYNSDYKTYSFLFRIYVDTWQPGACIFSNENSAKTAGFAVLLGDSPKTLTIRANGKTNTTKVMDKFNLGGWNHIAIVPNASSRSAATKYDLYVGANKCDFDASACAIEDIALANVVSNPAKIGEGFKGYLDEMYFSNQSLGLGMIQAYANRVIVPTVEQGRNVAEMNASGFLYNFDNPRNLGYSSFSQDYIADYIRSLYSGYSPAKVVLSVRGHNESGKSDNFSEIWGNDTKVRKFAQDLINAASNYDGVEFDLEWCQNATQWSNLSKLSDAVEALLPAGKTFRISVHAAYYDFPKAKINHNNITGFTVQQYGPNATFYPYSTFTKTLKDMESYGYPKDKVMPSFSTTMQGGGDIRGGAFANYKLNDNDVDTYNGMSFMGPMQIFKRARYARENNYQGIFYWAMGNDYWLGDKNMGSGGVANYQGMPEFNGAKYCSYGLNANVDRVVLSAKISHPDTEYAEGEEVEIPDLDDEFGDNVGDNPGDDDNNGDTSNVNSLDSVEYVDVYTIGGVLIKKNAVKSELNNQLEKGIYIIDGKQTLVR